jgi:hypothetical protein
MTRKRNITDEEIGLIKAMLKIPNDKVHFYFNRADRLVSSGRILLPDLVRGPAEGCLPRGGRATSRCCGRMEPAV